MNKTLRNKALRNINRLITADLNGENWYSPDGHFAVAYPIYDGYKVKKNQNIPENKPKLDNALSPNIDYIKADNIEYKEDSNTYCITANGNYWDVNADYYNLIMNIYPEGVLYVDKTGYNFTPIEVKHTDVLVGLLMPLKR